MTADTVESNHDQDHANDHANEHTRDLVSNSSAGGVPSRSAQRRGSSTNSTTKSSSSSARDKSILVADDTKALVVDAASVTGRSHNSVVKIAMAYYAAKHGWEPKLDEDEWVAAQLADLR